MLKKFTLTTAIIVAIVGFLAGIKILQFRTMGQAMQHMTMPPETVTSAKVLEDSWPKSITATGSIAAVQGVTVAAEVAGKIVRISFESGDVVKAGDVLVKLDTATEEAQLRAAEATAELAQTSLRRTRDLTEKQSLSQAELDDAEAQAKQAKAQADSIRAVIEKKTIRAPFAGRLGLRQVNLGQILAVGDAIATLQTLDPVYVNFSVPQQNLPIVAPGATVNVKTDAAPGEVFTGKVNAVSPEVDQVTRSLRVQATVANAGEKLRAGMFATVEVMLPTVDKVLAIPATAVLYAPYGDSVFVVEEKKDPKSGETMKVLKQEFVRLGEARGDFVAVVSGLKAGDEVVTSGVFKLRPGMPVSVDNTLAPKAKLDPQPNNT